MSTFSEETYGRIEAYLSDAMTKTEVVDFEQQMENNEELSAEVELFRSLNNVMYDKGALNLQKTMNEVGTSFFQHKETEVVDTSPRIGAWSRQRWAIAASFLVFVVSTLLIWQIQSGSAVSEEALFAQYYETYDLNQNVRGEGDSSNAILKSGIQQYKSKEFAAAVQTFLPLAAAQPQNDVAVFALAHAYLNQNPPKLDLAKQQFERITTANTTIYVPKAQWFLALIALKNGDTEQAKILLKEVVASGDDIAGKARKLLEELK
ncbi:MAG: tol-pal system YbgF family protein [Chitinophagales bacterium]